MADEGLWLVPELDWHSWKGLGSGRNASRRLSEPLVSAAKALVARILETSDRTGGGLEAGGQALRVIGPAREGGVRIDGGPSGFAERTVSLVDLGWVLAAAEEAGKNRLLLDEALVNRLRYIDGTPRESSRWIDTKHALDLFRAVSPP
jgi:hypothetical protein